MSSAKQFFNRLTTLELNCRRRVRVGRNHVWVDREDNGDFTINDNDHTVEGYHRFTLAIDAANFLNRLALKDAAQARYDLRRFAWPVI